MYKPRVFATSILSFVLLTTGVASAQKTFDAKVNGGMQLTREAATHAPVPDVLILFGWLGEAGASCEHMEIVRSDAEGRFKLPIWNGKPPTIPAAVYKRGMSVDLRSFALPDGFIQLRAAPKDEMIHAQQLFMTTAMLPCPLPQTGPLARVWHPLTRAIDLEMAELTQARGSTFPKLTPEN